MKRFSIYGIVLLAAIGIVFFSMRYVSSKDISNECKGKDTIQQGNSNTEVSPNSTNVKCSKCCCNKKCDKSIKEENKDEEVSIGKNPNLNIQDTTKSNVTPTEIK